jgi:hypothetical protein
MTDQFLLYDQALTTWLNNTFPPILKGKTTQLLMATPHRGFADVLSGTLADNNTLTVPRISVTRLDTENDPTRFNCNRIRRLGFTPNTQKSHLISGKYPAPIEIPYQVDFWTKEVDHMNRWEQKILFDFASTYVYLDVTVNNVWSKKVYPLFLEGAVINNSDLEPEERNRVIRKTATFRASCWFFDEDFVSVPIARRIQLGYYDYDDETSLFDSQFVPPKETIGTGDGITKTFGPITLQRPPVLEDTPVIETIIGATTVVAIDDGAGNFVGDIIDTGTIVYATGAVTITFNTAPDLNELITITYFTDIS